MSRDKWQITSLKIELIKIFIIVTCSINFKRSVYTQHQAFLIYKVYTIYQVYNHNYSNVNFLPTKFQWKKVSSEEWILTRCISLPNYERQFKFSRYLLPLKSLFPESRVHDETKLGNISVRFYLLAVQGWKATTETR